MTKKEVDLTTVKDLLGGQTSVKDRLGNQWVLKKLRIPGPEEHHHEEQQAFRSAVRTYIAGSFAKQSTARRVSAWRFLEPAQVEVTTEHLEQLFSALESAIQSGLAQSVTTSTLSFVSNHVRDLDRRLSTIEAMVAKQLAPTKVATDGELERAVAAASAAAESVFGHGRLVMLETQEEAEPELGASHRVNVTVKMDAQLEPTALAEARRQFFKALGEKLAGGVSARVNVVLDMIS